MDINQRNITMGCARNNILNFKDILCMGASIMLALYIFFSHLKYSFSSTYFLYISFILIMGSLIIQRKIVISKQIGVFLCIILITAIGVWYTSCPSDGIRQLTFFLIYFFIFLLALQNNKFITNITTLMYLFSLIGMITVYIQFLFPSIFNSFLPRLVRAETVGSILWSYNVDRAFTGITASVSIASFSMAIVFFASVQKILDFNSDRNGIRRRRFKFVKIVHFLIAILSLFGIILTSKRGIFIATIVALSLTLLLDKDIMLRKMNRNQIIMLVIGIIALICLVIYLFTTNDYAISFLERFTGENVMTGRDVFYENALKDFLNSSLFNYIFGKGTGAAYIINDTGLHNVYLQILYDHGIIGIILYIVFFVNNLRSAVLRRKFYSMCLQIVFLAYCMSGNPLYDYYFFIPYLLYSCYQD